ncbi:unnamed protein product, partial [Phaeothamnion confervicola]
GQNTAHLPFLFPREMASLGTRSGLRMPPSSKRDARGRPEVAGRRERTEQQFRTALRASEAKQAEDWLADRHRVVERELSATATRLQTGSHSPGGVSARSSLAGSFGMPAISKDMHSGSRRQEGRIGATESRSPERAAPPRNRSPSGGGSPFRRHHGGDGDNGSGGSTKRPGADAGSIQNKILAAMALHGIGADQLVEFFLPSSLDGTAKDTKIKMWEAERVLAADLGIRLSDADRAVLRDDFSERHGSVVDVQALLQSLDSWRSSPPPPLQSRHASASPPRQGLNAWEKEWEAFAAEERRQETVAVAAAAAAGAVGEASSPGAASRRRVSYAVADGPLPPPAVVAGLAT